MIRRLIAIVFVSLALQAVGFAGAAAADGNHDRYCRALKPVCGLNQHPVCMCSSASIFSCRWDCSY